MQSLSLYELGEQIKLAVKNAFTTSLWVRAEISEIRENASGHCYLELVEKEPDSDKIIAKVKANIWSFTYKMLKPYFEQSTGQPLSAGLKVLVGVTVEYHEVYGISLTIKDIDPTFTVGDIAIRRKQIINRLQEEGVFDMNRELVMPLVAQRIAIISSPTAAGYGDFMDQLNKNRRGFRFYCKLFPAIMQGNQTEDSVIVALESVYQYIDCFDAVVIIRGGGATADLSAFDSYQLAYYCTQFPLPVITGIGHQRDETILDLVAHTSLKTPTAVAEKLIEQATEVDLFLEEALSSVLLTAKNTIQTSEQHINSISKEIIRIQKSVTISEKNALALLSLGLNNTSSKVISDEKPELKRFSATLKQLATSHLKTKKQELLSIEKNIQLTSPEYILQKGYSLTTKNGKVIKNSKELKQGDMIKTFFATGSVESEIKK